MKRRKPILTLSAIIALVGVMLSGVSYPALAQETQNSNGIFLPFVSQNGGTVSSDSTASSDSTVTAAAVPNDIRINFSPTNTAAPSGWWRDHGAAYAGERADGTLTYGWVNVDTNAPADLTDYSRNRDPNPDVDVFRETLMHMDHPRYAGTPHEFRVEVPNGTYQVLVQVGDTNAEGSNSARHIVRAEGTQLVDYSRASGQFGVQNATAVVTVNDGVLNVDQVGGTNTKIHLLAIEDVNLQNTPAVLGSTPVDGATNVSINTTISANFLHLPNASSSGATSLDNSTINTTNVRLFQVTSGGDTAVSGTVNGTGGGDAINFSPSSPLSANTRYRYVITNVKDLAGATLLPFSIEFTTGSSGASSGGSLDDVAFEKVGNVASGTQYSTLTIGPDGKLYGIDLRGGNIHRWMINGDGTLSNREVLTAIPDAYGQRLVIGLTFAPAAAAGNLVAYVSHSTLTTTAGPEWDGKISRLSGANLQNAELLVTNLPRSIRDHLTNSIAFRPSEPNVLYFLQGSNSAGGAPDGAWGNRPERLLSAALLRLDLSRLPANLPLDAQTSMNQSVINNASNNSPTMSDGRYNPYDSNAPLTIYGSGIRNAYDLVWHSNGQLYVPTNGTGGGSLSPASVAGTRRPDGSVYNGPSIPAVGPNEVQRDSLFRIDPSRPVGYYGHPNPLRGEYVLNRGKVDVSDYPAGTAPDSNYRGAAFDFEFNKSPNGVIEYKSSAHNGNLQGALVVVRFSGGSDIIALKPNGPNGDIGDSKIGISGFTGYDKPLDIVEDVRNGNLYVSDYGRSQIVLLRPIDGGNPPAPQPPAPQPPAPQPPAPQPPAPQPPSDNATTFEAENATISGPTIESGRGASGNQFVDYQNASGDYIEWTVNVAAGGATTINIQYANGSSASRPMQLSVNGSTAGTPQFASTGSWTTWTAEQLNVNLNSGNNTIRLTANGSSGPNVDYLSIAGAGNSDPGGNDPGGNDPGGNDSSGGVSEGTYRLQSERSGKCAYVGGSVEENGDPLLQKGCKSGAIRQRWSLEKQADGNYLIRNQRSNKCVDLDGSRLNNRDKLIQWSCNANAPQQLWSFEEQSNGNYLIRNKLSNKCIDLDGSKLNNRDALIQWSCNPNAPQHRWQLVPVN